MKQRCKNCEMLFNNKGSLIRHENVCNLSSKLISDYENGTSIHNLVKIYKSNFSTIKRFFKDNNVSLRTKEEILELKSIARSKHKHSDEVKKRMSNLRKEFLKRNPDKHPWKNKSKFKSIPCENFKKVLNEMNIQYISEFSPSKERHFSIDIYIPSFNIGVEVNGNQHYEKGGELQPYYQERHDFLKNLGYRLYEFHYSLFFNREKMIELINSLISNENLIDFNFEEYNKRIKKINKCKDCDVEISLNTKRCIKCNNKRNRKVDRPNIETLMREISELGYRGTGKKYGVSDNAVRKWLKV